MYKVEVVLYEFYFYNNNNNVKLKLDFLILPTALCAGICNKMQKLENSLWNKIIINENYRKLKVSTLLLIILCAYW